jgi:integrase
VFARKADAQRFLNETETAKAPGHMDRPGAGTGAVQGLAGGVVGDYHQPAPQDAGSDELLLRRLALPSFGTVPLAAISQRDVRGWVAELSARGLAPATVQKAYQLLGKVMGAAVDAGMLAQSPCRRVPLPKVEREEMRFLTSAEVATWPTRSMPAPAPWSWSAPTGAALGELAGLRRARVDLLRGTVMVAEIVVEVRGVLHIGPPKTRASRRTVGLPRFVVEELAGYLADAGGPEAFVFTAPQGGPLCDRVPGSGVAAGDQDGWAGRAAHPRPAPHRCGPVDRPPGANPKEVAARAGHASVSFTWTAAATCTRRSTARSATAWTRSVAPPSGTRWHPSAAASAARPWPQCGPGGPGNDESAADGTPTTL